MRGCRAVEQTLGLQTPDGVCRQQRDPCVVYEEVSITSYYFVGMYVCKVTTIRWVCVSQDPNSSPPQHQKES